MDCASRLPAPRRVRCPTLVDRHHQSPCVPQATGACGMVSCLPAHVCNPEAPALHRPEPGAGAANLLPDTSSPWGLGRAGTYLAKRAQPILGRLEPTVRGVLVTMVVGISWRGEAWSGPFAELPKPLVSPSCAALGGGLRQPGS